MKMNILVTLDANYLTPLYTMLKSLSVNNGGTSFHLYMIYNNISAEEIESLKTFCGRNRITLHPVEVDSALFKEAPVFRHYTHAMYYRLLAYKMLPQSVEKILYLDPDILIINPLDDLYQTALEDYLFAAAVHTQIIGLAETMNKVRLKQYEAAGYYNSGVLLMNLAKQRKEIRESDIFDFVQKHKNELILPDQDILNSLYGHQIRPADDSRFNFDTRKSETYLIASGGKADLNWVMENTAVLHFCGKNKPWHKGSRNRYTALYRHYANLAKRDRERAGDSL